MRTVSLAILLVTVLTSTGCATASHLQLRTVETSLEDFDRVVFIQGMSGCENLYVEKGSLRIYVSDLSGHVHLVDGPSREELSVVRSAKIAEEYALGIDEGPDGFLYVGASGKDWLTVGGAVFRVDKNLEKIEKISGEYPGLNGLVFDSAGALYFASSRMSFFRKRGYVYRMVRASDGGWSAPEPFLSGRGITNGMFFHRSGKRIVFTEMLTGVFRADPRTGETEKVIGRTRALEAYDDLCIDRNGNYWITDPPGGFLKRYDPAKGEIVRYRVAGVGQTSACGIREENGEEILYVTELKRKRGKPLSRNFDGRGVVGIPIEELIGSQTRSE